MLSSIIKKELIQLNVSADNWEDAIRKSTHPLVAHGKVTEEYVNKIIEIAQNTGPYIVITKHVALPHAPSEFGVKETAIGITTLKIPVNFGNKENDPVKYLFCLSAKDSTGHLEAMSQLVSLLGKKDFFELLDNSGSPNEIIKYIVNLDQ
ncbi:PTS system, ascorbate-specific IIA component [Evansella caseinilytica]|uniref:Ascorbate-specific PTS system EIIA component n=1 Tax=Evansella caseinilytica TaxID=1503961 RepID=A0A1H3UUZ5_9BACI|nr:PTS sugar transporter subunit IIA [Evansella caseinilytica]SDZ65629.1 PTS system, ascorbate-specific IIA component [Evansella caseinilytica]